MIRKISTQRYKKLFREYFRKTGNTNEEIFLKVLYDTAECYKSQRLPKWKAPPKIYYTINKYFPIDCERNTNPFDFTFQPYFTKNENKDKNKNNNKKFDTILGASPEDSQIWKGTNVVCVSDDEEDIRVSIKNAIRGSKFYGSTSFILMHHDVSLNHLYGKDEEILLQEVGVWEEGIFITQTKFGRVMKDTRGTKLIYIGKYDERIYALTRELVNLKLV